jgi:predicted acetyltransferase
MGQTYEVLGVGGVFTYPAFRKEGHAARIVAALSDSIRASGADMGLLFTGLDLHPFYGRFGWMPLTKEGVYYGDPQQPQLNDTHIMLLPLSENVKMHLNDFEQETMYVGASTW